MPRSVHNSAVELAKPLFRRKRRWSDTGSRSCAGLQPFSIAGRRYSAGLSRRFSPFFSDRFERRGLVYVGTNEKISCSIPKTNGDGISDSKTIFLPENYQTAIQLDDADLSDSTYETVSHRYLWTPGQQDKLLADVTPTETLWTLTDHLGTVRDIIQNTPSGLVVPAHIIYDAYGNVLSCTNTSMPTHNFRTTSTAGTTPPPDAGSPLTPSGLKATIQTCIGMQGIKYHRC